MFRGFYFEGGLGSTRTKTYESNGQSFNCFGHRKRSKTSQTIFQLVFTSASSPILLFLHKKAKILFLKKTVRRAPEKDRIASVPRKYVVPWRAIWWQIRCKCLPQTLIILVGPFVFYQSWASNDPSARPQTDEAGSLEALWEALRGLG